MKPKVFPRALTLLMPLLFLPILSAQTSLTSSAKPPATRPIPFHGLVSAVDQKNKTFSITGKETRIFRVTQRTKILKGASNATMNDIVDNQEISGAYWKNDDGSLEAKMVKLGPTQRK